MESQSVTGWIELLADGDEQAAEELWKHISVRLNDFAERKLDVQIRRHCDENDAANSAFHSLCRGLAGANVDLTIPLEQLSFQVQAGRE